MFGELRRYTARPVPNWGVLSGRVLTHSWTRCGTPYQYVISPLESSLVLKNLLKMFFPMFFEAQEAPVKPKAAPKKRGRPVGSKNKVKPATKQRGRPRKNA